MYLSVMWLGVGLGIDIKNTRVWKRFDYVLEC